MHLWLEHDLGVHATTTAKATITSKKYFILGFSHDVRSAILVSLYNKTDAKMTSADGAKWTKDNLGTRRVNKAPFCTRARELVP